LKKVASDVIDAVGIRKTSPSGESAVAEAAEAPEGAPDLAVAGAEAEPPLRLTLVLVSPPFRRKKALAMTIAAATPATSIVLRFLFDRAVDSSTNRVRFRSRSVTDVPLSFPAFIGVSW
jgi:hypothetical protein